VELRRKYCTCCVCVFGQFLTRLLLLHTTALYVQGIHAATATRLTCGAAVSCCTCCTCGIDQNLIRPLLLLIPALFAQVHTRSYSKEADVWSCGVMLYLLHLWD
jgi:hypothetical protein